MLAEDRHALEAGLDRLRGLEHGRATLVDMSALSTGPIPALPEGEGVVGRASELVRCAARFRPLVDRLLGAVVVVEDRAAAGRLAMASEGGLRFVSLDGEVWERGRVRAGSRMGGGLLHREMEIRELSGRLAELLLTVEAQERERDALGARRGTAVEDRATAQAEVDVRRESLEQVVRDLDAAARDRHWTEGEIAERGTEVATIDAEIEGLDRARVRAAEDLAEFQQQLERSRVQVADLDGAVRDLDAARQAASTAQVARERLLRWRRAAVGGPWGAPRDPARARGRARGARRGRGTARLRRGAEAEMSACRPACGPARVRVRSAR